MNNYKIEELSDSRCSECELAYQCLLKPSPCGCDKLIHIHCLNTLIDAKGDKCKNCNEIFDSRIWVEGIYGNKIRCYPSLGVFPGLLCNYVTSNSYRSNSLQDYIFLSCLFLEASIVSRLLSMAGTPCAREFISQTLKLEEFKGTSPRVKDPSSNIITISPWFGQYRIFQRVNNREIKLMDELYNGLKRVDYPDRFDKIERIINNKLK